MLEFRVRWEIDVQADDMRGAIAAARAAFGRISPDDPGSACVFDVAERGAMPPCEADFVAIDLAEEGNL